MNLLPPQFELPFLILPPPQADGEWLLVGARRVRLRMVRNGGARRYVLRLSRDGSARVTIPRGGSLREGKRFAERNRPWLEKQILRHAARPKEPSAWSAGTEILFRGERVRLELGLNGENGVVRFGSEVVSVPDESGDLRPAVEHQLRRLALRELPSRVFDLATFHGFSVLRVMVRSQRSRWGSCSQRRTISLNWRLIQAPASVRDYLILHELAHLKEMKHSGRFWREVARLCPDFAVAERWLKQHSELLR
jgi:predicted metal-dependent hydrolase